MNNQDKRYKEYRLKCAERIYGKQCSIIDWDEMPTYLDDASIDQVVRMLGVYEKKYYIKQLHCDATRTTPPTVFFWDSIPTVFCWDSICLMLELSAEQKAEALARVLVGEEKK